MTFDDSKFCEDLFLSGIVKPMLEMQLLGGAISRDDNFIKGVSMKRAYMTIKLMNLLPQLRDPHDEILLLESRMGITKLVFGLRTCQPDYMEETDIRFDKEL